jgi:histidine ammonia-lyase
VRARERACEDAAMTVAVTVDIGSAGIGLDDVERVALDGVPVALNGEAVNALGAARDAVEAAAASDLSTYGLNTGVGRFVDQRIEAGQTGELQRRVLRSHAAGVGDPYTPEVVRAAFVLRIATLARGHSGVRQSVVDQMISMLNGGVVPHVPARGSVGASGDLAPLAHLSLPLVGEGTAWVSNNGFTNVYSGMSKIASTEALSGIGLEPIELESKEGLSLINGTQFMCAMGILGGLRARRLAHMADLIAALSIEALRGSRDPFVPQVHELRPHAGQIASAANMHRAMDSSTILESHKFCDRVQDAYALRCAPQVHGASRDAIEWALGTMAVEARSVTDNPLVFPDESLLRSNGNFHGQPLAIGLDTMAIAVAELANISERRIERLVNPALSGLPAFLTPDGGLNSGYMIAQYTAAALVSENKIYCHPASVDSIPTSAAQEDHVSMGNHGGLKFLHVLENAERVLAIELLCAAQGVDFLQPRKPGIGTGALRSLLREHIPFLEVDRMLGDEIDEIAGIVSTRETIARLEGDMGWQLA